MRQFDSDFDELDELDYAGIRSIRHMIEQNRRADYRRGRQQHANRFADDPWEESDWSSYDDYDDNDYDDYDSNEFDSYAGVNIDMR